MGYSEYKIEIFFAILAIFFTALGVFFFNYTRLMIKKESAIETQKEKLKKELESALSQKNSK